MRPLASVAVYEALKETRDVIAGALVVDRFLTRGGRIPLRLRLTKTSQAIRSVSTSSGNGGVYAPEVPGGGRHGLVNRFELSDDRFVADSVQTP